MAGLLVSRVSSSEGLPQSSALLSVMKKLTLGARLNQGGSTSALLTIGFLCGVGVGCYPVLCRMMSSIPGLSTH